MVIYTYTMVLCIYNGYIPIQYYNGYMHIINAVISQSGFNSVFTEIVDIKY